MHAKKVERRPEGRLIQTFELSGGVFANLKKYRGRRLWQRTLERVPRYAREASASMIARMVCHFASMSATRRNWVRQRSRLWAGRWTRK
jgi:hypothetical protein